MPLLSLFGRGNKDTLTMTRVFKVALAQRSSPTEYAVFISPPLNQVPSFPSSRNSSDTFTCLNPLILWPELRVRLNGTVDSSHYIVGWDVV